MTGPRKTIIVIAAVVGLSLALVWIRFYDAAVGLPIDGTREVARAMIQFVSFLTAGWIAGFFYFYKGLRDEVQRARVLFEKNQDTIDTGFRQVEIRDRRISSLAEAKGIPWSKLTFPSEAMKGEVEVMKNESVSIESKMNEQLRKSFKVALATFVCLTVTATLSIVSIIAGGGYILLSLTALVLAVLLTVYSWYNDQRIMEDNSRKLSKVSVTLRSLWVSIGGIMATQESEIAWIEGSKPGSIPPSSVLQTLPSPPTP